MSYVPTSETTSSHTSHLHSVPSTRGHFVHLCGLFQLRTLQFANVLGESVATYVAELRLIAQMCNYSTSLDEMLRDGIMSGINDDRIQQRLLSEKGLTYKKALELSQGHKTAATACRNRKLNLNRCTISDGAGL